MSKTRVVITGAGVISSLAHCRGDLMAALLKQTGAGRTMPEWGDVLSPGTVAAPVTLDQDAVRQIDRRCRRSMGPAALFATLAARQAVAESGLTDSELGAGRAGCAVSSTMGSPTSIMESCSLLLQGRQDEISAQQFFRSAAHTAAFNVANTLGLRGVLLAPCSACASALQAIGAAYEQILLGRQEVMVAGGSDEVTPAVALTFEQLFAQAENTDNRRPDELSRPFDAGRTGLVCGEGAGMVVLESLDHARRRGATALAEVTGYATNCSGEHISQSDRHAIARCMAAALDDAGLLPENVDVVSAHATGTRQGDAEEAAALREVFGDTVPVSSLKGHLGHTLGASGAVELAAVLDMLRQQVIPATRNLIEIAPDCAGLDHVQTNRHARINTFVKNCFAFGGVNAVLVGRRFEADA
ncbi:MAG: beta-ketoacyl-[acyl-carrier-protein] synthase family protein [Lentisphaeria bacterium]|jgi:3-oxoacyl-[acyl-carrier-protein] synthase II|nr:beta-ketoacyl-[acyl-carrier-protein] synthase family protein [Lentisphaeria bacterium]